MPVRFGQIPGFGGAQPRPGPRNFVQGINNPNTLPYQVPKAVQALQGVSNFMDEFKAQKDAKRAEADRKVMMWSQLRQSGVLGEHMDNKKFAKVLKDSSFGDILDFEGKSPEEKAVTQNQQVQQQMMMPPPRGQAVPQQLMPQGAPQPSIARRPPPAPQGQFQMANPQAQRQWEQTYRPGAMTRIGRALGISRPAPIAEDAGVFKFLEDLDRRLEKKRGMQERMEEFRSFTLEQMMKAGKGNPQARQFLQNIGALNVTDFDRFYGLLKKENPGISEQEAATQFLDLKLGRNQVDASIISLATKTADTYGISLDQGMEYAKALHDGDFKKASKIHKGFGRPVAERDAIVSRAVKLVGSRSNMPLNIAYYVAAQEQTGNLEEAARVANLFPRNELFERQFEQERLEISRGNLEERRTANALAFNAAKLDVAREVRQQEADMLDELQQLYEQADTQEERENILSRRVSIYNSAWKRWLETNGIPAPEDDIFITKEWIDTWAPWDEDNWLPGGNQLPGIVTKGAMDEDALKQLRGQNQPTANRPSPLSDFGQQLKRAMTDPNFSISDIFTSPPGATRSY